MSDFFTVTVSQINRRLSLLIKSDKQLSDLYIIGEISNFTNHRASGHFYFTLKDDEYSIKCVMFRSYAEKTSFIPCNGMKVIVHGSVNVYEKDGANQIYVTNIFEEGIGEEYLRFIAAKEQLEKEGFFNQKRKLPYFPKKICIITSEKGAALQDMLNIIGRRCPVVKIILIDATVQGITAPESLCNAIISAQGTDSDLIIIGRGGGSAEDLSAFNDITLAKTLFASKIPTISAVGHETDFSIIDFVADLRAPTPSAAAELAVPDISSILVGFDSLLTNIRKICENKISVCENDILKLESNIDKLSPKNRLVYFEDNINLFAQSINISFRRIVNENELKLEKLSVHISDINPMKILSKGFSITKKDNKSIISSDEVFIGDELNIKLSKGSIIAKVVSINEKE